MYPHFNNLFGSFCNDRETNVFLETNCKSRVVIIDNIITESYITYYVILLATYIRIS